MPERRLRRGDVVVLTTLAPDGFPHHAFLSGDEVSAPVEGRVAVSLAAGSRSAANLDRRRRGTLLSSAGGALVTRAVRRRRNPGPLASDPARRLYVLEVVREVAAVPLPGENGEVATGLTYRRREEAEERRRRAESARELAAAVRTGTERGKSRGGER